MRRVGVYAKRCLNGPEQVLDYLGRYMHRVETFTVCHATLQDPKLYSFLLFIDEDWAAKARAAGCACGGCCMARGRKRKL